MGASPMPRNTRAMLNCQKLVTKPAAPWATDQTVMPTVQQAPRTDAIDKHPAWELRLEKA